MFGQGAVKFMGTDPVRVPGGIIAEPGGGEVSTRKRDGHVRFADVRNLASPAASTVRGDTTRVETDKAGGRGRGRPRLSEEEKSRREEERMRMKKPRKHGESREDPPPPVPPPQVIALSGARSGSACSPLHRPDSTQRLHSASPEPPAGHAARTRRRAVPHRDRPSAKAAAGSERVAQVLGAVEEGRLVLQKEHPTQLQWHHEKDPILQERGAQVRAWAAESEVLAQRRWEGWPQEECQYSR
jgi:hypothetical protein